MRLNVTQRQQLETWGSTPGECVAAAGFVAAFAFPVSLPLALYASLQLGSLIRRLGEAPPRTDHASRTTIGIGRMSALELADDVVGLALGFPAATKQDTRVANLAAAVQITGRATFFSAVAADEATDWLTAAVRAEERASGVPDTVRSHVRDARRQEAHHYFAGAADWLEAYALGPLESWIRLSPGRLERERQRVLSASVRDTPLRKVIEANLLRHSIAPFRAEVVASIFTAEPAGRVAEAFDGPKTAEVMVRTDQDLSTTGPVLVAASSSPWPLRAPGA